MPRLRTLFQGLFLLLFLALFLLTQSQGEDRLGYPVRIFLDFDPFILITTFLSAHTVPRAMLLALTAILLTMLLGRVFCGWICPLGTLCGLSGAGAANKALPEGFYRIKYYLLAALLAASLFGLLPAGIFDPLALLIRSLSISIYPALDRALSACLLALRGIEPLAPYADASLSWLRGTLLAFQEPAFSGTLLISLLFIALLLANRWYPRFWCRCLCPLGAFLGLTARLAPWNIRIRPGCIRCGACVPHCPTDACVDGGSQRRSSECLVCLACQKPCPVNVVDFARGRPAGPDLHRRGIVTGLGAGMLAVPLLRLGPHLPEPALIRPPGAQPEPEFLRRCVKCGECMKVCITGGLQPTFLEAGLEGIWTPHLVPRIGYCEYHCTLCGQVCPTGAIRQLAVQAKTAIHIGLASIDRARCLPHAYSLACIACQEVCPVPGKAIWLEDMPIKDRHGRDTILRKPHVDPMRCIGCGICEKTCPIADKAAITVSSFGESRSVNNRL